MTMQAACPYNHSSVGCRAAVIQASNFGKSNTMATRAVRWDLTDLTLDLAMHCTRVPDPSSVGQSFMVGVMQRSDISRRASAASASGLVTGFPARFRKELAVNISDQAILRRKRKPVTMQAAPRSGRERMGQCRRKGNVRFGRSFFVLVCQACCQGPILCTAFRSYCTLTIHVCRPQTDLSQRFLFLSPLRIRGL